MVEKRLKGLDGLRALCALFLLWGHIAQQDFCNWSVFSIPVPECCAYVFFVISGFLAGYRIDSISSLSQYYKKKANRILPLYYAYIACSVLVYLCLGKTREIINTKLLYYLFLVPSIPFCHHTGILPLVHLWFIGTLVLFYLIFPLFSRIKKERTTLLLSIGIIIFWFALKIVVRSLLGKGSFFYKFVGVTSFDILFLGVLGGISLKRGSQVTTMISASVNRTLISILFWFLFLLSGIYGRFIPAFARPEFIAVLSLSLILTQQNPNPFPSLDGFVFKWLGSISYEIYVIQILVIILLSDVYSALHWNIPDAFIYMICTVAVIGTAWLFHKGLRVFNSSSYTSSHN